MEGTFIEVIHLMNKVAVAALVIITIDRQWMAVAVVAVLSMGVVEEGVGLVLDGTIIGETAPTTRKMNAGTAELTVDGHCLVPV